MPFTQSFPVARRRNVFMQRADFSLFVSAGVFAAFLCLPLPPAIAAPVQPPAVAAVQVDTATRQEIEALLDRYARAYESKDVATYGALIAEDYQEMPLLDSKPLSRQAAIDELKNRPDILSDVKLACKLVEAHREGNDVRALVHMEITFRFDKGGSKVPVDLEVVLASGLRKTDVGWKMFANSPLLGRPTSNGKLFSFDSGDATAVRPVVTTLFDDLAVAYIKGDKGALEKLVTDNYVLEMFGNAPVDRKAFESQAVAAYVAGQNASLRFEVTQISVDGNTATAAAILIGTQNMKDSAGKVTPVPIRMSARETLKREGTTWKLAKTTFVYAEATIGGNLVTQYHIPAIPDASAPATR